MSFPTLSASDFQVFAVEGLAPRMAAIKGRIRPKLDAIERALLPDVERIGARPAFAHVVRHARRTGNPPADTWVAFAADRRGYKKHGHFKVAGIGPITASALVASIGDARHFGMHGSLRLG